MFSGLLQKMVERIDGAEAAAILGLDGIIIERAGASGPHVRMITALFDARAIRAARPPDTHSRNCARSRS